MEAGRVTDTDGDIAWLLARETPRLRRFAIALTGSVEHGDDLVQDTLERALRKQGQVRRQTSVRSWLFTILHRTHVNQAKRRRTERDTLAALQRGDTLPPNQDSHVEVLNIAAALRMLPPDQREAVLLVGLEGFGYDEAARITAVPMGTLKSRLYRGREALWAIRHGDRAARDQRGTG
jgi:RNA polymerase sigma-70 factor (ECF subfamily)